MGNCRKIPSLLKLHIGKGLYSHIYLLFWRTMNFPAAPGEISGGGYLFVVHFGGACYFPAMKTEHSEKPILHLKDVVFEGVSGKVGPLNIKIESCSDHVLPLDSQEDGLELIRIIKGITAPERGRVFKGGEDVTGWIVRDGCVALVEPERFFSVTVRDEISFAAMAGEARGKAPVTPLLSDILDVSGLRGKIGHSIDKLSGLERQVLALASSLLMLPSLLVFLDSLDGFDEVLRDRYIRLVALGKKKLEVSTLQIAVKRENLIPLTAIQGIGIRDDSRRETDRTGGF